MQFSSLFRAIVSLFSSSVLSIGGDSELKSPATYVFSLIPVFRFDSSYLMYFGSPLVFIDECMSFCCIFPLTII